MIYLIHVLIAIVSAVLLVRLLPLARVHLPMICVLFSLGLLHGVVPAITPPLMRTLEASDASRELAAWYALFGIIALALGYEIHASRHRNSSRDFSLYDHYKSATIQLLLHRYFWISMFLGLLGAALYVQSSGVGFIDYARATRFEFRHHRNVGLMWARLYLSHLAFAPGFLAQFMPRRYRLIGTTFAIVFAGFAFFFLFKGTRHIPLGILGGVVVGYILNSRLALARAFVVACAGSVLITGTVALYEARKELNVTSISDTLARALSTESLCEPLSRDPLNYHEHFVGAVEYFPSEHPFLNGATYQRVPRYQEITAEPQANSRLRFGRSILV
jgi:hypothetical protein